MDTSTYKIRLLINDIKKRWRMRALKQGVALTVFTFLFFAVIYMLLDYRFEVTPFMRGFGLTVAALAVSIVSAIFIVRPMMKKLDSERIGLYIEEKMPDLHDRINSAVEIDRKAGYLQKDVILDKLIDDASRRAGLIEISTVVDRSKERILSYSSNALLFLFVLFIYVFMDDIRDVASQLEVSLNPAAGIQQEFVTIDPGNIEREKGESQEIIAELRTDTEENVVIHYKTGDENWQMEVMEHGLDRPIFMHQFVNIQEPIRYYIEIDQERTPEYTISLYEYPKVEGIDLSYKYPRYTGLPSRTEENTGDIKGLKGTQVTLTVRTNGTAPEGEMVVNDEKIQSLQSLGEGVFSTTITLEDPAFYHIRLTDPAGKNNKFPDEYRITTYDDEQPIITITEPQRDIMANPVEEVLLSVEVTDDFGVNDIRLTYTVNGEEDTQEPVMDSAKKGETTVEGAYLFYLEDQTLQAGDIITYYVEAEDNFHTGDPEASDMYFIRIIPLDNRFSQVENPGGQPQEQQQQEQQQQPSQVIKSQEDIIAATWNIERTKKKMTKEELGDAIDAVKQSQANLKDNIEERLNSTAFSTEMMDAENQEIAEYFRKAAKEMGDAVDELDKQDTKAALKPEQRALNNLLRADALNKEKQVRLQQQQQQSGSQSQSNSQANERITELMDLELDISKNKYEMQEQRQQEQQQQEVDELLEKLRELARRQQRLANQSEMDLKNQEEEERPLDRLKREQEQLQQDMENLAEQMRQQAQNNPQITPEQQQRLQQAAQNMQQAAQAMSSENPQQALSQQQQAMNEMERVQRELEMSQADNSREMVENFVENFDELKQEENRLARDLETTNEELRRSRQQRAGSEDIERLNQQREEIQQQLRELQEQSAQIEQQTRTEDPETAAGMRNFRNSVQREELEQAMDMSRNMIEWGLLNNALSREEEIRTSLEKLDETVDRLVETLPLTEEEQLQRDLEEAQELIARYNEVMELMGEGNQAQRMSDQQNQQGQQGQQQQGQQQQNQQQQNQQGQRGQQQNQQNQQQQNQQGQRGQQQQQQNQQGQRGQQQQGQGQRGQQQRQLQQLQRGQQGQQQNQQGQQQNQQGQRGQQQQGQRGQQQQQGRGQSEAERRMTENRIQQQLEQMEQMLENMLRTGERNPNIQQALNALRNVSRADNTGVLLDDAAKDYFKDNVFEPISQIEEKLREELYAKELENKIVGSRSEDIPPEYRKMVEKYFHSIAQSKSGKTIKKK
ncbi:DUF4175 family protein [candidate division KSB1 bacterium]